MKTRTRNIIDLWLRNLWYYAGFMHRHNNKKEKEKITYYPAYSDEKVKLAFSTNHRGFYILTASAPASAGLECKLYHGYYEESKYDGNDFLDAFNYVKEELKNGIFSVRFLSVVGECNTCIRHETPLILPISENNGVMMCDDCKHDLDHPAPNTDGYAYVAGDKELHIYKIGASVNPISRIHSMDSKSLLGPIELKLIHKIKADDKREAEQRLHRLFADSRKRGEWFILEDDQINEIQKITEYKNSQFMMTKLEAIE